MGRRKIREFDAKRIIADNILQYGKVNLINNAVLIGPETSLENLPQHYPWLSRTKLVVKPDQLFGKRKKLGLVLLEAGWEEAVRWLKEYHNKEVTIGTVTDRLTHFLIEPYISHQEEYYLAITSERDHDIIHFSLQGGMDIEEQWDKVQKIAVPTLQEEVDLDNRIPEQLQPFVKAIFQLYRDLDFTYLEFNPFTLDQQGQVILLDTVAEVDDCAQFRNGKRWGDLPFPPPFGRKSFPEEDYIAKLDEESGASLKLTVLNPQGRIWNILSGGGASIIYLDAIANHGQAGSIANYGEYSGNPTTEESYQYAKTVLDAMTRSPSIPGGKILFIAGAIANFTDVEKTFTGVVRALREYQEKLRAGKVSIFVRRGGPNWEKGLELMKRTGLELRIPMEVSGPEMPMTMMVPKAMEKVR